MGEGGIITHGFWFIRCFSFRRSLDRDMGRSSIWSSLNEVTLRETTLYVWLSDCPPPPPPFGCVCGILFSFAGKVIIGFRVRTTAERAQLTPLIFTPNPPPPLFKKRKKKEQYDPYKNINISQKQETWLWPFFSCFKLSNVKCTLLLGQDATEIEANFFFRMSFYNATSFYWPQIIWWDQKEFQTNWKAKRTQTKQNCIWWQ